MSGECDLCGNHALECICNEKPKYSFYGVKMLDKCIFCSINYQEGEKISFLECEFTTCDKHKNLMFKGAIY